MESYNIKNLLPWRFLIPFIVIIIIELSGSYFIDYYKNILNNSISEYQSKIKNIEDNLLNKLKTEKNYVILSYLFNVYTVLNNRRSVNDIIDNFNKLMPKFLTIKTFSLDLNKETISIDASVPDWLSYVRFYNYLKNNDKFNLESISSPKLSDEKNISFSLVLRLKENFYKYK